MKAASAANTSPVNSRMALQHTVAAESARHVPSVWNQSPWKWFFSLGLGVILLLVLIVASTIGTLIDPLPRAQALVFYTWWYKLLLLALAVVMACATFKTIMLKILPTRELHVRTQKGFFETAQLTTRLPFQGSMEQVATAFRRHGFQVRVEGAAGMARSGWYGRLGAPVSHIGMVIVLLAGFASSWVAREAMVQIPEGRENSSMQMSNNLEHIVPMGFTITLDDFSTGFFPRTRIPSHYTSSITVRDGEKVLYTGPVEVNHSPIIKGWRLHQTSYQEIPNLPRFEVTVAGVTLEAPIKAKISPGQTITLAGEVPMALSLDNRMNYVLARGGEQLAAGALGSGGAASAKLSLVANRFEPDFVLGEDRQVASRSLELNNPALHVTLLKDGAPSVSQWLFGREDMRAFSHSSGGEVKMELLDVQRGEGKDAFVVAVSDSASGAVISQALLSLGEEQVINDPHAECPDCGTAKAATASAEWNVTLGDRVTGYATVLTLSRNPAIPSIYFGCALMMAGLMLSFFVPRRDIWFLHDKDKGMLSVAAHYRHPSDRFDRATSTVLARIERSGSSSTNGEEL